MGARTEWRDPETGRTALMYARTEGMIRTLLRHGAEPNARCNRDLTPIAYAPCAGSIRELVDWGADPNAVLFSNVTEIMYANTPEKVLVLAELDADVNARTRYGGQTVLTVCMFRHRSLPLIRALVETYGADIYAYDDHGKTLFNHSMGNCPEVSTYAAMFLSRSRSRSNSICFRRGSNPQPFVDKTEALPIELQKLNDKDIPGTQACQACTLPD